MDAHSARLAAPRCRRVDYRVLDPKFRDHKRRYVLQCLAATAVVFAVLSVLDAFHQTVLVAALGASAFIAFTMPHINASRPRYLIGGYLTGIAVGCAASMAAHAISVEIPPGMPGTVRIAFAALATGVALFVMVITNTEHPPAAALALGFVLNDWDALTVLTVLGGVVAISIIKECSKRRLIDLL